MILFLTACSKDQTNRNPYLQEIGFRYDINLNLPLYSTLTNPGSAIYIPNQAVGTRGVFVMNTGFSQYRAFEGSCPNHAPSNCSTMILDGQNAVCPCDDYAYSLFTGQFLNRPNDGKRYYDMLEYRATANGNIIVISN
ncbi:MAG: hypothetical protein MUO53_15385 [Maribacter sp.]|nr:hypothetical protein [Maribacter sp.]